MARLVTIPRSKRSERLWFLLPLPVILGVAILPGSIFRGSLLGVIAVLLFGCCCYYMLRPWPWPAHEEVPIKHYGAYMRRLLVYVALLGAGIAAMVLSAQAAG